MKSKLKTIFQAFFPIIIVYSLFSYYRNYESKINYNMYTRQPADANATKPEFSFVEKSDESGLKHISKLFLRYDKMKNYRAMTPTVTSPIVADINNDGFMDVFVTTPEKGVLGSMFINNKDGSFTNVSEKYGITKDLNPEGSAWVAGFFDYDNDGYKDLYLAIEPCHMLLKNVKGEKFADVSKETGVNKTCKRSTGLAFLDFNLDGFTDVYLTNTFKNIGIDGGDESEIQSFFIPRANKSILDIAGPNILIKNINGSTFQNMDKGAGAGNGFLAWSVGVSDLNDDGYPDLMIANDFSGNRVFINQKNETFEGRSNAYLGEQFDTSNMGVEFGDVNNDGLQDVYITNISRSTFTPNHHDFMYVKNADNHAFSEKSEEMRVDRCGWAWGSKFADFDLDGKLDLFVVNGFFSDGPKDFWYAWSVYTSLPSFMVNGPEIMPNSNGSSLDGNQRSCLFWQGKDGKFSDITNDVGITDTLNGRGISLIDTLNDGKTNMLVTNHNSKLLYYKHNVNNKNNWIGFDLVGTKSAKDAFGAKLEIYSEGKLLTAKEKYPTNSFSSQSDPRLLFGLGNKKNISILIRWPSGQKSNLALTELNKYVKIEEPK